MSCRAAINRDLEFHLAHVALSALRRDDHKWCEICREITNHRTADHEQAAERNERTIEPEEEC